MTTNQSTQNGSVRQKGNCWYYRFRIQEPDGTWKLREFKGGNTKRETQQMLAQAIKDYNEQGLLFDPGSITVSQLCDEWWEAEIENGTMAVSSRGCLQNAIQHIKRHALGSKKLKDVSIEDIQAYMDLKTYGRINEAGERIEKAYAKSTLRKHRLVLNNIFKFAVYPKRYLRENPMQYVKQRKQVQEVDLFSCNEEQAVKKRTITHEEYEQIISFLKNEERYAHWALPVQIAYLTGLREGEICGLDWSDIDFEKKCIYLKRSMTYDPEEKCWELKVPKSGKPRIVEFGETLEQILKEEKERQLREEELYGIYYHKHYVQTKEIKNLVHWQIFTDAYTDNGVLSSRTTKGKFMEEINPYQPKRKLAFICTKPGGELLTPQSIKYVTKIVKKNLPNISHYTFHGLRHTYATNLVQNKANMKDVQGLLGHSDIKITMNTYAHDNTISRRSAVDILEQALS